MDLEQIPWFFQNNQHSGIFNCGTSQANSYNKIADIIIGYFKKNKNGFNLNYDDYKNYIKFPDDLKDRYQPYSKSNNENIKSIGYKNEFYSFEGAVNKYLKYLDNKQISQIKFWLIKTILYYSLFPAKAINKCKRFTKILNKLM